MLMRGPGLLYVSPGTQLTIVRPQSEMAFAMRSNVSRGAPSTSRLNTSSVPMWMNGIFSRGASAHSSSKSAAAFSATPGSDIVLNPNARRNASACPGKSNSGMTRTPRA